MLGQSLAMRTLFDRIRRSALSDSTVLITGESGTGKELVASAIHRLSRRSTEAFITINISELPVSLIEAELFGVCKGAYTGATHDRDGLFATATHLLQRGLPVAYFLQVPELGIPARDCLGRPLTLSSDGNSCTVKYADYRDRMLQYRDVVRQVVERAPFLRLVDPEPLLCNSERCSGFIDNTLLYADDNHLSVAGSRLVAPLVLQQALGRNAVK